MSFPQKEIPSDNPPADEADELASDASQSTQQPQIACVWSAHVPRSGSSPSPFPRNDYTLTETANADGDLFLFGGFRLENNFANDSKVFNDVYVFSSRHFFTTLLQTSGEVPIPRFKHGAALFGTTLLICGGQTTGPLSVLNHDSLHLLNLGTSDPFIPSSTLADYSFALQKHESGPAFWSMVLGRAIVFNIPQMWSVPGFSFLVAMV